MIEVLALPLVTYGYITIIIINVVLKFFHVLTYNQDIMGLLHSLQLTSLKGISGLSFTLLHRFYLLTLSILNKLVHVKFLLIGISLNAR